MSNMITPTIFYRTIKVEELKIFYREAGPRDAPTVLLLHGFPSSSHMFRNLIPMLADSSRSSFWTLREHTWSQYMTRNQRSRERSFLRRFGVRAALIAAISNFVPLNNDSSHAGTSVAIERGRPRRKLNTCRTCPRSSELS